MRQHQKGVVWRVVRRYTKRDSDAADITQQVFVRAFNGLVRVTFHYAVTELREILGCTDDAR